MTQQGKNAIDLVLAESLIELSAKKPIDKITIKEITDKAGVIRPTFYNHFQDKYELIEWIIKTELLEPIKPLYRKHTKVYRQSVLVCRIRLERPMFQYSRDAKLVKEDIVVMDAIGVENVEENEKYNFLLSC